MDKNHHRELYDEQLGNACVRVCVYACACMSVCVCVCMGWSEMSDNGIVAFLFVAADFAELR